MPAIISCTAEVKAAAERLRSRTWVAPSEVSKEVFLSDAVVIIGEKPERRANWIAGSGC